MKSLVWFRNDLRMDDNPALRSACAESEEVHALYIYSKNQMELHNEANCKIEFMISNLQSLEKSLKVINIPFTIIHSDGINNDPSIILNLIKERAITNVYSNKHFGIDEESRDIKVQDLLKLNNINFYSYDAQVLYPAGTFKTQDGWIQIIAVKNHEFIRFCNAVGWDELIKDERFKTNANRRDQGKFLTKRIQKLFKTKITK